MAAVTGTAGIANLIMGVLMGYTMMAFAAGTFLTSVVWLLLCQRDLRAYRMSGKEWIFLAGVLFLYFLTACCGEVGGLLIYAMGTSVLLAGLYFGEIRKCWKGVAGQGGNLWKKS